MTRRLFIVLTLVAFASQGFIAQTHIHGVTQETLTALSTGQLPAKGKLPAQPDEKNCPLCRLSAFVGSCVVPLAVVILPLPVSAFPPLPEAAVLRFIPAVSFHWQIRAPPR